MNKYIGVFLKTGAAFGLIMGVFFAFQNKNISVGSIGGIISGILFGFTISVITYYSDKKLKTKGIINKSSDVYQYRKITVKKPISELLKTYKEAISSLKKCKIVKDENGDITARTGFSWKSFGEIINISAEQTNDKETVIEISSKPSLRTTMADYGKNLENIEALVSYYRSKYGENIIENT